VTKARVGKARAGKARAGRRKGSGTRAAEALALVKGQPGIAIPELAQKMGIKQNYLYRVLPGLRQEGKVVKRGRGWHPKG
jgi:DNA-binding IclR family transcriptional regulator